MVLPVVLFCMTFLGCTPTASQSSADATAAYEDLSAASGSAQYAISGYGEVSESEQGTNNGAIVDETVTIPELPELTDAAEEIISLQEAAAFGAHGQTDTAGHAADGSADGTAGSSSVETVEITADSSAVRLLPEKDRRRTATHRQRAVRPLPEA